MYSTLNINHFDSADCSDLLFVPDCHLLTKAVSFIYRMRLYCFIQKSPAFDILCWLTEYLLSGALFRSFKFIYISISKVWISIIKSDHTCLVQVLVFKANNITPIRCLLHNLASNLPTFRVLYFFISSFWILYAHKYRLYVFFLTKGISVLDSITCWCDLPWLLIESAMISTLVLNTIKWLLAGRGIGQRVIVEHSNMGPHWTWFWDCRKCLNYFI